MHAADYGVPQKRERVIICGIRNEITEDFKFPNPILTESDYIPLKIVLEKKVDKKYFFSERAVQGMLKAKPHMNKGRAQDIDSPCNTVGAHLAKMSLNSTNTVLLDDGKYRRFTPREVARIQSFPKDFKLIGSDTAQYKALGNAIPPVIFWYISRNIESFFKEVNL